MKKLLIFALALMLLLPLLVGCDTAENDPPPINDETENDTSGNDGNDDNDVPPANDGGDEVLMGEENDDPVSEFLFGTWEAIPSRSEELTIIFENGTFNIQIESEINTTYSYINGEWTNLTEPISIANGMPLGEYDVTWRVFSSEDLEDTSHMHSLVTGQPFPQTFPLPEYNVGDNISAIFARDVGRRLGVFAPFFINETVVTEIIRKQYTFHGNIDFYDFTHQIVDTIYVTQSTYGTFETNDNKITFTFNCGATGTVDFEYVDNVLTFTSPFQPSTLILRRVAE